MNTLRAAVLFMALEMCVEVALGAVSLAAANAPPVSLCSQYSGPAFVEADESRNVIAVHAGQFPGMSFVSFDAGRVESRIAVPQRFLAASMPRNSEILTLALAENYGVRIESFNVVSHKQVFTRFIENLTPELSLFARNEMLLVGVTNAGDLFKIDIKASKVVRLGGAGAGAQAIAIGGNDTRLYIAGNGLAAVDIDALSVVSMLSQEKLLLGMAVSPDNSTLAVRNLHSLELLDATSGAKLAEPIVVDATPDAVSMSSVNIAFSPDGSQLFYAKASASESELISLSRSPLVIERRARSSPYSSAIATVPDRNWILLTTGEPGKEQLEAFDMKTLAIIFKVGLDDTSKLDSKSKRGLCPGKSQPG